MDKADLPEILFFRGVGNSHLAKNMMRKLAEHFGTALNMGHINHRRFADGELDDAYPEFANIKGKTLVFFECLKKEADVLRFLQLCWAAKDEYGAKYVIAVVSFMHYRRQDRPENKKEINRNKWLIKEFRQNGIDHLIVATPHSSQMAENCQTYDIAFRGVSAAELFASTLKPYLPEADSGKIVEVYAPDEGSIQRAVELAVFLKVGVLFNLKHRKISNETVMVDADLQQIEAIKKKYAHLGIAIEHATAQNVKGKIIVMVEDEIDTCSTANRQGVTLLEYDALEIYFCVTHAVCSDGWKRKIFAGHDGPENISNNPSYPFTKVIVCDTIFRIDEQRTGGKMHDVSMASPLAAEVFQVLRKL